MACLKSHNQLLAQQRPDSKSNNSHEYAFIKTTCPASHTIQPPMSVYVEVELPNIIT